MRGYMNAMRRYFDFSGRSSRSEFWFFVLFYIIIYIVAAIIDAFVFGAGERGGMGILTSIVVLAHLIPSISVSVRRLHDIDRTGWWVLFFWGAPILVMVIGGLLMGGSIFAMMSGTDAGAAAGLAGMGASFMIIVLVDLAILIVALVFYCTAGTPGPNRFGPPPTE
jgi:uncharacterized membrane protein YhaH (DUF805 family)